MNSFLKACIRKKCLEQTIFGGLSKHHEPPWTHLILINESKLSKTRRENQTKTKCKGLGTRIRRQGLRRRLMCRLFPIMYLCLSIKSDLNVFYFIIIFYTEQYLGWERERLKYNTPKIPWYVDCFKLNTLENSICKKGRLFPLLFSKQNFHMRATLSIPRGSKFLYHQELNEQILYR